jgi:hypothetical protein
MFEQEKKKMKNMNTREKMGYIWDYYKIHIILSAAVLAVAVLFIHSIISAPDRVLNVVLMGEQMNIEDMERFNKEAEEGLLGKSAGRKAIDVQFLYSTSDKDDPLVLQSMQKFTILMAAGDIDILVLGRQDFEAYSKSGMFLNLEQVDGITAGNGNFKNAIIRAAGSDGREAPYGIDAGFISALKDMGYDSEGKVMCVASNSKRLDMAGEFLNWIIK